MLSGGGGGFIFPVEELRKFEKLVKNKYYKERYFVFPWSKFI